MTKVMKFLGFLGSLLNFIAILATVLMMLLVIADVIMRSLFSSPIVGATEMIRMLMVCIVPSFVSALLAGSHVRVGIFVDALGRKGQLIFDTFGYIASALICGLIAYQSLIEMRFSIDYKEVYSMLRIPKWPLLLIFSISFGLMVPTILALLVSKYVDKDAYKIDTKRGGKTVE